MARDGSEESPRKGSNAFVRVVRSSERCPTPRSDTGNSRPLKRDAFWKLRAKWFRELRAVKTLSESDPTIWRYSPSQRARDPMAFFRTPRVGIGVFSDFRNTRASPLVLEKKRKYLGKTRFLETYAHISKGTLSKCRLAAYLRAKLESLRVEDKTQHTILCTWLVELQLRTPAPQTPTQERRLLSVFFQKTNENVSGARVPSRGRRGRRASSPSPRALRALRTEERSPSF